MYEAVIGLEIHTQLLTATKLFCGCGSVSGAPPNTRTCPTCLGLPGAMPVLNGHAVDQAVAAGLALGCTIRPVSVFARKNYFYPDLPKGYQITQYDQPLAVDGRISWERHDRTCEVGVIRVHLEEDAGKSLHEGFADSEASTYLDFNRSGVPLAEIVTAPDLRSPDSAAECFRQLRSLLVEAGVSDGNLEEGNLRCDANVSVRIAGTTTLGEKTEVKNLNSFRFLQRALEYEIARQIDELQRGGTIDATTLLWDDKLGVTVPMRNKEDAREYRYFPEPDLPPLVLSPERIETIRRRLPEPPDARRRRLRRDYGLNDEAAAAVGASPDLARYFEAVAAHATPVAAAQWVRGELTRRLRESSVEIDRAAVTPDRLARLIGMVERGEVSASAAKQMFARMFETGETPEASLAALGLTLVSDSEALDAWIAAALAAHPAVAAQHREGSRGALGFLVGQVMKASGGRANPRLVDQMLRERLGKAEGAGS